MQTCTSQRHRLRRQTSALLTATSKHPVNITHFSYSILVLPYPFSFCGSILALDFSSLSIKDNVVRHPFGHGCKNSLIMCGAIGAPLDATILPPSDCKSLSLSKASLTVRVQKHGLRNRSYRFRDIITLADERYRRRCRGLLLYEVAG